MTHFTADLRKLALAAAYQVHRAALHPLHVEAHARRGDAVRRLDQQRAAYLLAQIEFAVQQVDQRPCIVVDQPVHCALAASSAARCSGVR